ncbi:MAG: hypothetical protein HYX22_00380 [Candidatus Yanofskybacteria bacterium]|nr:hypothetical protein [Candidatus Yanofskybacteria bacterium]
MGKAILFLTIIFFSNFIGMYYGMYSYWWFDTTHHFLGGFFVAMLFGAYFADTKFPSKRFRWLAVIGATTFIGVVWEFAEYAASQTLIEPLYHNFGIRAYFIGDLNDTIKDLLMDIVGAFSWLAIFVRQRK